MSESAAFSLSSGKSLKSLHWPEFSSHGQHIGLSGLRDAIFHISHEAKLESTREAACDVLYML